jgi:thiol-disulfide isomerase/thioredoxin
MIKKLLMFLALVLLTGTASAQSVTLRASQSKGNPTTIRQRLPFMMGTADRKSVKRRADAESSSIVLRYWSDDDELYIDGAKVIGQIGAAIYLPEMSSFVGDTIRQIYFMNQAKNATDIKVFVRSDLNGADLASQAVASVAAKAVYNVTLDKPYIIDGSPIYVGYTMNITALGSQADQYPMVVNGGSNPYGYYALLGDATYNDWEQDGANYGNAIIAAVVTGKNMPHNTVLINSMSSEKALTGDSVYATGTATNYGVDKVDKITVNYKYGTDDNPVVINLDQPMNGYGTSTEFQIDMKAPAAGHYKVGSTITKVGDADNVSKKSITSYLVTMEKSFPRTSVMEEGTGAWCGYCPRGITGIENLKTAHPDNFIAIAVHSGDKMEAATYSSIINKFSGFPDCLMDRKNEGDPHDDADTLFAFSQKEGAEGTISLSCKYKDASKSTITVSTKSKFSISADKDIYRVAYALFEDGVTGPTYYQKNYYNKDSLLAGGYSEDELNQYFGADIQADWFYKPYTITPFVFNHVGRAIYSADGVENSIQGAITPDFSYTHSMDIALPDTAILNKDNVHVVALLLDSQTGEIVNAAQVMLDGTSGIGGIRNSDPVAATVEASNGLLTVNATNARAQIFTTDGRLVATKNVNGTRVIPMNGRKGIFMVRISNGESSIVKKVVL